MWFQNRRAKWRKQARLTLLQDAWRLRCLGLTNSSSMLSTESLQRQSPKPDVSPSSNSPTAKMSDMKMLKDTSDECDQSQNRNDAFTLMHPAFQNVLLRRKYYGDQGTHGIDATVLFDKNTSNRDCNAILANVLQSDVNGKTDTNSHSNIIRANDFQNIKNGEMNQDSSGSEEIDLISNSCIDFSYNNNVSSSHNRKG